MPLENKTPIIEINITVGSGEEAAWTIQYGDHCLSDSESDDVLSALDDIKQAMLSTVSNIIGRDFETMMRWWGLRMRLVSFEVNDMDKEKEILRQWIRDNPLFVKALCAAQDLYASYGDEDIELGTPADYAHLWKQKLYQLVDAELTQSGLLKKNEIYYLGLNLMVREVLEELPLPGILKD